MSQYIMKLTDGDDEWLLEWSTVVDAPVTRGMTVAEFHDYYRQEYGEDGLRGLAGRLSRVEQWGTSGMRGETPEEMIALNRAGPDESPLTMEQIIEAYCRNPERG